MDRRLLFWISFLNDLNIFSDNKSVIIGYQALSKRKREQREMRKRNDGGFQLHDMIALHVEN